MAPLTLVTMLYCGQGMMNLIEVHDDGNRDGKADYLALVDCGGNSDKAQAALELVKMKVANSKAGRLDLVIISHQDADHVRLLPELGALIKDYQVGRVVLGGLGWGSTNLDRVTDFHKIVPKSSVHETLPETSHYRGVVDWKSLGKLDQHGQVFIRILLASLEVGSKDVLHNSSSAVVVVEHGNSAVILPGDARFETMDEIVEIMNEIAGLGPLNPPILPKVIGLAVPHHGAINTAVPGYELGMPEGKIKWDKLRQFIGVLNPQRIGVSAGPKNEPNKHPKYEVLQQFTTVQGAPTHSFMAYVLYPVTNVVSQIRQGWNTIDDSQKSIECTVQSIGFPEPQKKKVRLGSSWLTILRKPRAALGATVSGRSKRPLDEPDQSLETGNIVFELGAPPAPSGRSIPADVRYAPAP